MCLAEPGRVVRTCDGAAFVETPAGSTWVSLAVAEAEGWAVDPGDWVLVSLGLALETLSEADARSLIDLLADIDSTAKVTP